MLKIRLRRTGAKKQPSYRLVVAESTSPRDGTFLENLGHYNPLTTPTTFVVKEDRVRVWLQRGAQPTDRVLRFLDAAGMRKRAARSNPQKGQPGKKRVEREEAKRAAAEEKAKAAAEAAAAPPEPAEPAPAEPEQPAAE